MYFASAFTTLLLPALAAAQAYGPPPGPAQTTSSSSSSAAIPTAPATAPAGNVYVQVGFNNTFTYNPNNFNATNGTVVTFFFPNPGFGHSVTQSSFAEPCTYLAANTTAGTPGGFDSGLQEAVQFSINITDDTQPIWFFCKQVDHCGMGMVGAINAPVTGNFTFSALQSAALQIGANEPTATSGGPITGGVAAVATASPSNTFSASGSTGSSSNNSGATGLTASMSVGIISLVVSLVLLA